MSNDDPLKSLREGKKERDARSNVVFLRENGVKVGPTQEKRLLRGERILDVVDIPEDDSRKRTTHPSI